MKQSMPISIFYSVIFLFVMAVVLMVIGHRHELNRARHSASDQMELTVYGSVQVAGLGGPASGKVGLDSGGAQVR